MRKIERILLVAALVLGALAFFGSKGAGVVSSAQADDHEGGGDEAAEHAVAYVGGFEIMQELIESERFAPELAELRAELQEKVAPLEDEMAAIQEEAREMMQGGQPDPAAQQELQRNWQRVQQEMQALQTEYQPRIEELQRQSLQRAWEELRASAQAVADRKGFTYVMMAQDPADDLNASGPDADEDGMSDNPGQEIQKRTVLVAPEGTNITADVRADLNLG